MRPAGRPAGRYGRYGQAGGRALRGRAGDRIEEVYNGRNYERAHAHLLVLGSEAIQ